MGSEDESSIEAAAAARRERLKALRAAQELLETPDDDKEASQDQEENDENFQMKFRNYLPQDKHLQEGKLAPPVLPKFDDPMANLTPPEDKKEKSEDPFLNIAPKKPNWDLRRDVQKKLDKLEKRTLKALHQLGEEEEKRRLAEEQGTNS
nr:coiled-coil domain-containing protein 12 [Ipomoea batatas]